MKLDITNEQYRQLIKAFSLGKSVIDILSDGMEDSDYKGQSIELVALENHLLQYASDFNYAEIYHESGSLAEDYFVSTIMAIMDAYDEYTVHSLLVNKLAWRDFRKDHSQEEIDKMGKENFGYFGVELDKYENKYWDEFSKHGMDRLFLL